MNGRKLWVVLCFSAMAFAAQPAGIPTGAVKVAEGYRYTDAQGHRWIYRQTPFGVSRTAADTAAATPAPSVEDHIRAIDHGATVSFERPGPFGVYRWERKKQDMDATERAAFERQAAADAGRK